MVKLGREHLELPPVRAAMADLPTIRASLRRAETQIAICQDQIRELEQSASEETRRLAVKWARDLADWREHRGELFRQLVEELASGRHDH